MQQGLERLAAAGTRCILQATGNPSSSAACPVYSRINTTAQGIHRVGWQARTWITAARCCASYGALAAPEVIMYTRIGLSIVRLLCSIFSTRVDTRLYRAWATLVPAVQGMFNYGNRLELLAGGVLACPGCTLCRSFVASPGVVILNP